MASGGQIEDELVGAALQLSKLGKEMKLLKQSLDAAEAGKAE